MCLSGAGKTSFHPCIAVLNNKDNTSVLLLKWQVFGPKEIILI